MPVVPVPCPCGGDGDTTLACQEQLFERIACDDTNGDGVADVQYTQVWAVRTCSPTGDARLVGNYLNGDFSQPYTPVNPVDCSGLAGAPGTTPIETVGLCLADGTPIAVTVVRDCDGVVTQTGWINLQTGDFTAGDPPAGTISCGDSQSIQVSGVFCDVLADGTVAGLVLVEYHYAADGSIESVRLVNAADGTTYVLQGELSVCPGSGTQQDVELDRLCVVETATGDVLTRVLVEYVYDTTTGQRTGVRYVDEVSGAPVAVPGGATLTSCPPDRSPCRDCETIQLCDVRRQVSASVPSTGTATDTWLTLTNGVRWQREGNNLPLPSGWYIATQQGVAEPEVFTFDRPVEITFGVRFTNAQSRPLVIPEGWEIAGLLTSQHDWDPATRTISPSSGVTSTGVSTFRAIAATSKMIAPQYIGVQPSGGRSDYGQITVSADVVTPFLRTICRDCDGAVTGPPTDTALDGQTAYVPAGEVMSCDVLPPEPNEASTATAEPCAATMTSTVLCDTPPGVPTVMPGEARLTDTDPTPYFEFEGDEALPGGGSPLWNGGTLIFPAEFAPAPGSDQQYHNTIAAVLTAETPGCDDGTGTVDITATVTVENLGPDVGYQLDGLFRIMRTNGVVLASTRPDPDAPVGYTEALTITALAVPVSQVEAGEIIVYLDLENYDSARGSKAWETREFSTTLAYTVLSCPEPVPFLRNLTTDCSGAVVATNDRDLDGVTPYAVQGEVGVCAAADSCCEDPAPPCPDTFATECATLVEEQWSYDNTGGFDGTASNCGGLQGPVGGSGFPSFGCAGQFRITSWLINGVDVITTPLNFDGGPCGNDTGLGMHDRWSALLTQIDPDATWVVDDNPTCGYYVRTTDAPEGTEYGAMVIQDRADTSRVWTATPNHSESQTYFTKVYTKECDGGFSIQWLDARGNVIPAPTGEIQPCGGSDSVPCLECDTFQLCDVQRRVSASVPSFGSPTDVWQTLTNGVRWQREGNDSPTASGWYVADEADPEEFTFDRPVEMTFGVRFTSQTAQPLVIPEGWEVSGLLTVQHFWDPVTRRIGPTSGVTPAGVSTFRADPAFRTDMIAPTIPGVQPAGDRSEYGQITVFADVVTPFLRTICRNCEGVANAPTDTTLDGQTEYVTVGQVTSCDTLPPEPQTAPDSGDSAPEIDRIVQPLCITDAGVTTPFLRHWTVDNATGDLTFVADTELDGATPLGAVSGTIGVCGSATPAADAVVDTGIARITAGTWTVPANGGPGTQSVTMTVLSGTASVTGSAVGAGIIVPAGVSLTWSVSDTDDSVLNGLSISPGSPGDVLINWTRKATVAG